MANHGNLRRKLPGDFRGYESISLEDRQSQFIQLQDHSIPGDLQQVSDAQEAAESAAEAER